MTTRSDVFPRPSLEALRPFLKAFEPSQTYPRGAELFPQGAPARSVFVVRGGLVRLQAERPDRRQAILALATSGSVVGAAAALADAPYAVSAVTVTRCEAYRLPAQAFRELVRREAACSWYVHQLQAYENQEALARITGLTCLSARERLDAFIEDLAEALSDPEHGGEIPFRDRELAQIVAVTPPYLSRLLKKLVDDGRLRRVRGVLYLAERAAATPPAR